MQKDENSIWCEDLNGALADFRRLEDVRELPQDDRIRVREQTRLISGFHGLVTIFYEFGWGPSFHFSPRRPGENLRTAQRRHHEAIGSLLRLRPGMEVADIGSGARGPLVDIAQATGASITGINFNAHQIRRGEAHVQRAGPGGSCGFLYADFMNVPLNDGAFDALYSFESLCHAPNRRLAFQARYRPLTPGGEAAIMGWRLTDAFDGTSRLHNDIRERIQRANATSELPITSDYVEAVDGPSGAGPFVVFAGPHSRGSRRDSAGHPPTPTTVPGPCRNNRNRAISQRCRGRAGRRQRARHIHARFPGACAQADLSESLRRPMRRDWSAIDIPVPAGATSQVRAGQPMAGAADSEGIVRSRRKRND